MTAPKDPSARVVGEILAGRHDGRFGEIAEAIQQREKEGHTRFIWRITLGDDVWDARSVTVGEVRFVEQVTGDPWRDLDPRGSMDHFVGFVIAHLKANGEDHNAAVKKAEAITQEHALLAVDDYELVNPPKDDSPAPTST